MARKERIARRVLAGGAVSSSLHDARGPLERLSRYCTCGAALDVVVVARAAAHVEEAWRRVHSGPRHRPTLSRVEDPLRQAPQMLAEFATTEGTRRAKPAGGDR